MITISLRHSRVRYARPASGHSLTLPAPIWALAYASCSDSRSCFLPTATKLPGGYWMQRHVASLTLRVLI
ncbi:MAG: hypothetical protein ACRC46_08435 [Thermoguttaceae bacterium]